jgi:hypothetical protein
VLGRGVAGAGICDIIGHCPVSREHALVLAGFQAEYIRCAMGGDKRGWRNRAGRP